MLTEQVQADRDAAVETSSARHLESWEEGLAAFHKLPRPARERIAGRAYGFDPAEAARSLWRDIAETQGWYADQQSSARDKTVSEEIERRVQARLNGEEPSPDLGTGQGSGTHRYTLGEIRRMSPEQYQQHEAAILAQWGRRAS